MNVSSELVRVAMVDDSEVVRLGLRSLLATAAGMEVVAEGGTVKSAEEIARTVKFDVMLLDIRLPDGYGFDACRAVLRVRPEARVIFLTSVVDDTLVERAVQSGAQGYLLKDANGSALLNAVVEVARGGSILDPLVTRKMMDLMRGTTARDQSLDRLSPQEKRVVAAIAEGKTNKEVAQELGLSEKTVKNYLSAIFEKLNITRRSQAAALYVKANSNS